MNAVEAAAALKMLEGTAKLMWNFLSRFLGMVVGVTATMLFQTYLFVRLFPAFV
jgi:hypothetical protein